MPAKLRKVRLELYGNFSHTIPSLSLYTETVDNSSFMILGDFPFLASFQNQLRDSIKSNQIGNNQVGLGEPVGQFCGFPLHYIQIDHPPNV